MSFPLAGDFDLPSREIGILFSDPCLNGRQAVPENGSGPGAEAPGPPDP